MPNERHDIPDELLTEVLSALRDVCRGRLAEFKVVRTRRSVDVLRLTKRRFAEKE